MRHPLLLSLFILANAHSLPAQIIPEALQAFPTQTEVIEYENLASLRALPNYDSLQQQFCGKPLAQAKAALQKLGILESQVNEMVIGTSPGTVYGLLGGTFNGAQAAKAAIKKGLLPVRLENSQMFCPGVGTCLLFFEDWIAGFGAPSQLKTMLQARQGVIANLSLNRILVQLMNNTANSAPVRGAASGGQLLSVLTKELSDKTGFAIDWPQFYSGISVFAYSVTLDSQMHVNVSLACKSTLVASLLTQTLTMLANVQSAAVKAGKDPANLPFQNLEVVSSENIMDLRMDTKIPTP
jgi:hypothetical protein